MPTRIISWQSVVTQSDPSFFYSRGHLPEYEWSNGRIMYANPGNPYVAYVPMTDDGDNPIESDIWHNILETDSINPNTLMPGAALVNVPRPTDSPRITDIVLLNTLAPANSSIGTVIGTLDTVPTNNRSLTGLVYTMTNSSGGLFEIINSNQVAFASGTVGPGVYDVTVEVSSTNAANSPQSVVLFIQVQ